MDNPLGVITGDKELKIGIAIDFQSLMLAGVIIMLSVALGSIVGAIVTKSLR